MEATPLHAAAEQAADLSVMDSLLAAGAEVDAQDATGDTPLHRAARRGRKQACRALLSRGANPELKNNEGKTPREIFGEQAP